MNWVPLALLLFGLGSSGGVTFGGRFADATSKRLFGIGLVTLFVGWLGNSACGLYFHVIQGTLSFDVGSTPIARALHSATSAPTLAGGFATAALNVGAATGPALGGLAIDAGAGFRSPMLVSAALVAMALLVVTAALPITHSRFDAGRTKSCELDFGRSRT